MCVVHAILCVLCAILGCVRRTDEEVNEHCMHRQIGGGTQLLVSECEAVLELVSAQQRVQCHASGGGGQERCVDGDVREGVASCP